MKPLMIIGAALLAGLLMASAGAQAQLVVPRGDDEDPTRDPAYYDQTFDYLSRSGMALI